MIEVTMMLYPHGYTAHQRTLATIRIVNDGTGTLTRGNYRWSIMGKNNKRVLKHGVLLNWPRQSKTPVALLQKVINTAYPKGCL